jgi:hypothetical protein
MGWQQGHLICEVSGRLAECLHNQGPGWPGHQGFWH